MIKFFLSAILVYLNMFYVLVAILGVFFYFFYFSEKCSGTEVRTTCLMKHVKLHYIVGKDQYFNPWIDC